MILWISINKTWSDVWNDNTICKPGNLLCVKDGRVLLVGDINALSGLCDCCSELRENDLIIAYKDLSAYIDKEKFRD
jgi:hypothetical protein